ncbi:Noc2p family-domain-containing protein [Cunninghamella echinulata]|nr:Noc2p family-domain-containing protein [Cunninghamella echinulata]
MAKTSKATVKFQKNKLKGTIERRRKSAVVKNQIKRRQELIKKKERERANKPKVDEQPAEENEEEKKESKVITNLSDYFCNYMLDSEESLDLENDEEIDVNALDSFEAVEDEESKELAMEIDFADRTKSESSDEEEDDDDMEDDEDMEEEEEEEDDDDDIDTDNDAEVVTKEMLNKWTLEAAKKSPEALKHLLLAFRSIAREGSGKKEQYKYCVNNSKVYTKLVKSTVQSAYPIFSQHILVNKKVRYPAKARFWPKLKLVVQLFLNNVVRFIRDLDQDDLLVHILTHMEPCAIYFGAFPILAKQYIRVLLDRWSDFSLAPETRLVCYKAIRKVAIDAVDLDIKKNHLPYALKGVYLVFAKRSTKVNEHTLAPIQQMMEEAADLYTIDSKLSHEHAHVYISQLAEHLKTAKKQNTIESFKSIYTWQYITCLDFWSNVIAVTCNPEVGTSSTMQALLKPIVDLSLHTLRLNPTSQFLPLRVHILRSLTALIDSTGFYIPLAPYLFEMFENEIFKPRKENSNNVKVEEFEWEYHLKTPKVYFGTKVYQDAVFKTLIDNILDFYACFGLSIAFPELAIPAIAKLKEQRQKMNGSRFVKSLKTLIEKMEGHKHYIEQKRAPIEYTPSKLDEVSAFLRNTSFEQTPLGSYLSKRVQQQ